MKLQMYVIVFADNHNELFERPPAVYLSQQTAEGVKDRVGEFLDLHGRSLEVIPLRVDKRSSLALTTPLVASPATKGKALMALALITILGLAILPRLDRKTQALVLGAISSPATIFEQQPVPEPKLVALHPIDNRIIVMGEHHNSIHLAGEVRMVNGQYTLYHQDMYGNLPVAELREFVITRHSVSRPGPRP